MIYVDIHLPACFSICRNCTFYSLINIYINKFKLFRKFPVKA